MNSVTEVMQMSSSVVLEALLSVLIGIQRGAIQRGNEAPEQLFLTVCNFLVVILLNIAAQAVMSREGDAAQQRTWAFPSGFD